MLTLIHSCVYLLYIQNLESAFFYYLNNPGIKIKTVLVLYFKPSVISLDKATCLIMFIYFFLTTSQV